MSAWEEDKLHATICHLKKHRGETWYDVITRDRDYVRWVIENIEQLEDDLRECLEWGVDHVPDRI